jgi:hypothetical protein
MKKEFKTPPRSVSMLTAPKELSKYLSELIGKPFIITGLTRRDGSNIRKLIAATLENHQLPEIMTSSSTANDKDS